MNARLTNRSARSFIRRAASYTLYKKAGPLVCIHYSIVRQ